jgi:hypothetical protein
MMVELGRRFSDKIIREKMPQPGSGATELTKG